MTTILVVDDEPQIRSTLRISLSARGYEVQTADDGQGALTAAADGNPDAVMLDLGLPDIDGTDVISALRERTAVPIIVLSGRTGPDSKIEALDAGADDYVSKPFGMDELLARLRAALRRASTRTIVTPVLTTSTLTIDLASRYVRDRGSEVHLTPTEWRILAILVRNSGKLVRHEDLLHEVWGPAYTAKIHYLRLYLTQLRHKLEADPSRPRHLITAQGMGYRVRAIARQVSCAVLEPGRPTDVVSDKCRSDAPKHSLPVAADPHGTRTRNRPGRVPAPAVATR